MSLKSLHAYLGQLLDAGLDPNMPVVSINDGWPCEIADIRCIVGRYHGDPSPKMSSFSPKEGNVLALIPITEDVSDLLNSKSHSEVVLPVEATSPI